MNIGALLPIADWSMHGSGAGWWIPMMVFMVLFWGAIIVGIFWVVRNTGRGSATPPRPTPSEILDERFAEGVLSAEEYEARKEVLTGRSRYPAGVA